MNEHMYVPIERIDKKTREVFGRATVEDVDSYQTIFSYDASKEAFKRWMDKSGNIREMHQPKAVGKAVRVEFDDENRQILVRAKISKSADGDNTWAKVEEGILNGFSVGASNGVWDKTERNGKQYDFLTQYNLVELSLVDNPATPGCQIEVARVDGFVSDVLEEEEVEPEAPADEVRVEEPDETRKGARHSVETSASLHTSRDHSLQAAKASMDNCRCDECSAASKVLDPDADGDIDIVNSLDADNDAGASGDGSGSGSARAQEAIEKQIATSLTPMITRMNGIAARFAQVDPHQQQPEITRRLEAIESKLAEQSELRSLVSEVKEIVNQIAAQPQAGGPIVNSAVMRSAPAPAQTDQAVLERLSRAGVLNKDQQINAAMHLLKQGR